MAKVRIQARTSEHDTHESGLPHSSQPPAKPKHTGAIGLLIRVLKTEGFVGWYQASFSCHASRSCRVDLAQTTRFRSRVFRFPQGMSAQIVKAVLSQALLFVSKEQFERWALTLMLLLSNLKSAT